MIAVLLISALAAGAASVRDTLTDAAIAAYAAKPFDKRTKMLLREVLGVHHGVEVVADYICSDLCPDYTVRVIHYNVKPGPDCDAVGGRTVMRRVPRAIATFNEPFCVPKAALDGSP